MFLIKPHPISKSFPIKDASHAEGLQNFGYVKLVFYMIMVMSSGGLTEAHYLNHSNSFIPVLS